MFLWVSTKGGETIREGKRRETEEEKGTNSGDGERVIVEDLGASFSEENGVILFRTPEKGLEKVPSSHSDCILRLWCLLCCVFDVMSLVSVVVSLLVRFLFPSLFSSDQRKLFLIKPFPASRLDQQRDPGPPELRSRSNTLCASGCRS